jgi:hypothetical protein
MVQVANLSPDKNSGKRKMSTLKHVINSPKLDRKQEFMKPIWNFMCSHLVFGAEAMDLQSLGGPPVGSLVPIICKACCQACPRPPWARGDPRVSRLSYQGIINMGWCWFYRSLFIWIIYNHLSSSTIIYNQLSSFRPWHLNNLSSMPNFEV